MTHAPTPVEDETEVYVNWELTEEGEIIISFEEEQNEGEEE